MGQKVHPYGFRVGYIYDWKSRWFANKQEFPKMLLEDVRIRKFVKKALATAAVSKIEVERASDKIRVLIYSARPGIIIGRRGAEIEKLKEELHSITGKEVLIDYRGPVEGTVQEILGGVRSACTYVGARRLKELSKRTTFIRVARQLNEVFGS